MTNALRPKSRRQSFNPAFTLPVGREDKIVKPFSWEALATRGLFVALIGALAAITHPFRLVSSGSRGQRRSS